MTVAQWIAERNGNAGRRSWNARPQSVDDAQKMLAGAVNTIDRLLEELRPDTGCENPDGPPCYELHPDHRSIWCEGCRANGPVAQRTEPLGPNE
jgi:hypothetical protein